MRTDLKTNNRLKNVRVMLLEQNPDVRAMIKRTLQTMGFTSVVETKRPRDVIAAALAGELDFLICDLTLQQEVMCTAVRDIRIRRLGVNPFPITVGLTGNAEYEHIRQAVNSGYDMVLLKPLNPSYLRSRMRTFLKMRKPFLISADYVGPDRRDDVRPEQAIESRLIVPNPIKLVADGVPRTLIEAQIRHACTELDEQKVYKTITYMADLAERMRETFIGLQEPTERQKILNQLNEQADDALGRISATDHQPFIGLCNQIKDLTARLTFTVTDPDLSDVDRLLGVAMELQFGIQGKRYPNEIPPMQVPQVAISA